MKCMFLDLQQLSVSRSTTYSEYQNFFCYKNEMIYLKAQIRQLILRIWHFTHPCPGHIDEQTEPHCTLLYTSTVNNNQQQTLDSHKKVS